MIYTSLSRGYVDAIAAHEISIRQYMSDLKQIQEFLMKIFLRLELVLRLQKMIKEE